MDWWTKFKKIFSPIIIIAILSFIICAIIYQCEASQAESKLQEAEAKLKNVIENQREEAKLHPEDTSLKQLDFLNIVGKELEYNQDLAQVLKAESSRTDYLALAAFLLAVLAFMAAFSPGAIKESFKNFSGAFKGRFKKKKPKKLAKLSNPRAAKR